MDATQERKTRRAIGWWVAGAAAVFGVGSLVSVPHVENQLTERVTKKAAAAGFGGITATFSGQDGTVHCPQPVKSPSALKKLVEDEWGVRHVKFTGCGSDDGAGTDGTGTDGAGTDGAGTDDGDGGGTDDGSTSAGTTSGSTAGATSGSTAGATTSGTGATAGATTGGATSGSTTSGATTGGSTAGANSGTTAGSTAGTTSGAVAAPAPMVNATINAASPRVVLTGTVQTAAQKAAIVAAATKAFGAGEVKDQLKVSAPAAGGTAMAATPAGTAAVAGLEKLVGVAATALVDGRVAFDGKQLSIAGTYTDAKANAAIAAAARGIASPKVTVSVKPRAQATASQAAQLEGELNAAVSATPIPFATGTAALTTASDPILDKVATAARKYGGVKVSVNGYTDADGDAAANQALSQKRADAVKAALVKRGVPAEQLVATGYGEASPVAPNDTPENKAKNRRVVFAVAKT